MSYDYDPAGRRTSMTVAGQTFVSYSYDNANRLTQIAQGSATVSFNYDAANRRTSLTLPNGVVMSYSYDNASQLSGISYTNGSTNLGSLTYGYDLAGRRTSMGGSLAQTALPLAINEAEYNANNQLTEWGTANLFYDANGNMTSDGVNSYVWNARNQLASMNLGANSFAYDGYSRRVGKTISSTTTNYLYDGANIVQELSGGSVTANLLGGLGIDERFTRTDTNGTANFLTDPLGSTLELTNSSGSALAQYSYEPFGNTFVTSGSSANSYEYTGRENDGTGVYFNRGRYYSPTLQRFISEDPLGFKGGDGNVYAYVGNSPIGYTDSFGTARDCFTSSCGGVPQNLLPGRKSAGGSGGSSGNGSGNGGGGNRGGSGSGVGGNGVGGNGPNPIVALGADAVSLAGAATGHSNLGAYAGAAISVANDPSLPNVAWSVYGLLPVAGDAVGPIGAVIDGGMVVGQFLTNQVMAPMVNAAPPQTIDGMPNPALMNSGDPANWDQ